MVMATMARAAGACRGDEAPRLVLVDTGVWIEALHPRGDSDCKRAVQAALAANTAATCEMVLAEVLQGALDDREADRLDELLQATIQLPMAGAGAVAARISRELRARGISVKIGDLLICGTALVHGAALMHRDKHLRQIAELAGIEQVVP